MESVTHKEIVYADKITHETTSQLWCKYLKYLKKSHLLKLKLYVPFRCLVLSQQQSLFTHEKNNGLFDENFHEIERRF